METILIIGAGYWHTPLFERAKKLGLKIIGVDLTPDPPGRSMTDAFYASDVRDQVKILEIAKSHSIDAVVTGVDLAVPTVAYLANELDLPGPTVEVAKGVTNKLQMRLNCERLGLKGPKFYSAENPKQAMEMGRILGSQFIVKPEDSFGSRGVSVILNAEENQSLVKEAIDNAFKASFSKRILVEEFMQGVECSVEGFVDSSGELKILGISEKRKSLLPHRFDLELTYPCDLGNTIENNIRAYAHKLQKGFKIESGLVHIELMITQEEVRLIEIAGRGCGAFVIGKLLPAMTGIEIYDLFLRQALGHEVTMPPFETQPGILKFLMAPKGRVKSITGLDKMKEIPGIIDAGLFIKTGDLVNSAHDTSGRAGYILGCAKSRARVSTLIKLAEDELRIEMEPVHE